MSRKLIFFTGLLLFIGILFAGNAFRGDAQDTKFLIRSGSAEPVANEFLPKEKAALRTILHAELGDMAHDSDLAKVKKLLAHQAKIGKLEYHQYDTTKEKYRALPIYRLMREGDVGYLCAGQADLFIGLVEIYGLTARRIIGESMRPADPGFAHYQKSEGYCSHSNVEVLIDGRWIIADPTYGLLPRLGGRYVSLGEALAALCRDRATHFEFEMAADSDRFEKSYHGRPNDYFRDQMFARVIVYKPFHKYPYDDVHKCCVRTATGPTDIYFSLGCGITLADLTPFSILPETLKRDRRESGLSLQITRDAE